MTVGKPLVFILCTGNSCRCQMAEAFLRKHQSDNYDVNSAGMSPADDEKVTSTTMKRWTMKR